MVVLLLCVLIAKLLFIRYLIEEQVLFIMARKGTPEYEIWKMKYQERRKASILKECSFLTNSFVITLKKKLKKSLLDESSLIMFMFLSKIDYNTLSVFALSAIKDRFLLDESDFNNIVNFFKTLSKDILKRRLLGVNNFYRVNQAPDTWSLDFQKRYSKQEFKERYGCDMQQVFKAYEL